MEIKRYQTVSIVLYIWELPGVLISAMQLLKVIQKLELDVDILSGLFIIYLIPEIAFVFSTDTCIRNLPRYYTWRPLCQYYVPRTRYLFNGYKQKSKMSFNH